MENKNREILVVGSVVRDIIVSANGKEKEFFGGTGANICYGLGILGLSPTLFSVAGNDFCSTFSKHLKKHNVNLKIFVSKKGKTALFLTVEEKNGKEIESWHPNVFNEIEKIKLSSFLSKKDFQKIKIAIFSPGTAKSTVNHMKEFSKNKSKGALAIFDPGQRTDYYSKEQLEECCKLSDMLILNELEFKQVNKKLNKKLLKLFKNKILIKTLGHKGSKIYQNGKTILIPVVKPKKVINAVGAGDAYRSGLIYGMINGFSLEKSCKLGAQIAVKNVECLGCQRYCFKKALL